MSEWLDIRTHEDHAAGQERILNPDTGETRVIPPDEWPEGLGPSSAGPLETMIEELVGERYRLCIARNPYGLEAWLTANGEDLVTAPSGESLGRGPIVEEAIAALYRAWRERE